MSIKILFFAGSSRKQSYNKKLAHAAYEYAKSKGVEATFADLIDYPMPIMNEDLEAEEGMPEKAIAFKKLMAAHDGFFIATPEYNSMFPPLLKNTIDWCTRTHEEGEPSMIAFKGKIAGLAAASEGGLGGIRVLPVLRQQLQNISVMVVPNQLALSAAHEAFDDQGGLVKDNQRKMLHGVVDQLIETTRKMKG